MPQIFHRSANTLSRVSIFGALFFAAGLLAVLGILFRSPYETGVGVPIQQPVPFSHKHHVGDEGLDCRYCHTSVEESAFAGIPSTAICMNCHSQIWVQSPALALVRESFETGAPIAWNRVNDLPDFAYFNHNLHVQKGFGCETCHGRVDQMPLVWKANSLQMEWCLDCHRHAAQLNLFPQARWHQYEPINLIQPLIAPLYGGHSAHELLAIFSGQPERSGYDIVRAYWQGQRPDGDFEQFWRTALHDGFIPDTALPEKATTLRTDWAGVLPAPQSSDIEDVLEIIFRPDPSLYDGRFANNGWLQELPKPLTKLTWDNAALLNPATAERLGLANEDVIELRLEERRVEAPVWILPGHANDSVTVHLGYGRTRAGEAGTGVGFNAYALRTAGAPWFASGLAIRKTGRKYPLATTQLHHLIEGRNLLRVGTLADYQANPNFVREMEAEVRSASETESLYPEHPYEGYRWGMAIDLTACVGCNACVIACQAENNIPIVGKDQVLNEREMHWLRVDSYFIGEPNNPQTFFQPVPCMQCENAPCEVVCPVAATVHSEDGLNDMVYNRCVGTRYCSNNCPYKVRRFNFLQYADYDTPSLKMLANPDVTVRTRGVMEKCTYCVQRIRTAQVEAEKEGRRVRDGEVVTACQAVCPAEAIVFGDLNDPESRVAALKAEPLNYAMLAELNTHPRTTYLAALRNPNPEIEAVQAMWSPSLVGQTRQSNKSQSCTSIGLPLIAFQAPNKLCWYQRRALGSHDHSIGRMRRRNV